jgi:histidine kinase
MLKIIPRILRRLSHSLSFKLSFSVGLITFIAVGAAAYVNIGQQRGQLQDRVEREAEGFVETVRRATHWSMLNNQRESLHRIINDVASQPDIKVVRVFNKDGQIMFSSDPAEIGRTVDMKAEACYACHAENIPLKRLSLDQRTRIFTDAGQQRALGTILPIYNQATCSGPPCHAHPPQQQVLGVLDVVMNLASLDRHMEREFWQTLAFAAALFLAISTIIGLAVILTVNRSVKRLKGGVDRVAEGGEQIGETLSAPDELGTLADSINLMAQRVAQRSRYQDQRYRMLVNNSTDAVFLVDHQGRLVMANPEAGRILGRGHKELEGSDALGLVHPGDRQEVSQAWRQSLQSDEPSPTLSFRASGPDGSERILEGRFRRVEGEGGAGLLLGNLRDITERRALECELDRRRALEERLISQAFNAIIATDAQGVVRILNQSAEKLLAVRASEVEGVASFRRFFPRAQIELLNKHIFNSPGPGSSLVRNAVVKTADGQRLPVMLSARALFDQGQFSGVMFFLQNLRESKHLKAQLLRKTRLAAVGETVAGLAHCIKNLLHGLGAASYLVDQGLNDNDPDLARQGWRMVRRNLDQVEDLTQDLLAYAKDRRPQYQVYNLNRLLEEAVELVRGRAEQLGVELEVRGDPSCDRAMLDPQGIRRVVLNLLSNSLDALAEAEPGEEPKKVVLADGRDGYGMLTISVSDNGPGIPPEARRHLFTSLFSTKGSKGTGLGLLVSQKIVEEHGGAIECFSAPGEGARFTLAIPDIAEQQQGS